MRKISLGYIQRTAGRAARVAVIGLGVLALAPVAHADTMSVSASIPMDCSVGSATSMAFNNLGLIAPGGIQSSADFTASAAFPVICTSGTTNVSLGFTGSAGSGFAMTNGSDTIAYTLYANSGRTTAVTRAAQVAANLFDGSFVANGVSHTLNVYGKIANAAAQTKPIGDYADTVTITVAFGE